MTGEKMYCYSCQKDVSPEKERDQMSRIYSFFPNDLVNESTLERLQSRDEKTIDKVSEKFFALAVDTPDFLSNYKALKTSLQSEEIVCPECEKPIYAKSLSRFEGPLYHKLWSMMVDHVEQLYVQKIGVNPKKLITLMTGRGYEYNFLLEQTKTFFPERYEKLKDLSYTISNFDQGGGRGGDGDFSFFTTIYNFLTDDLVKNAFYDLLKYGAVATGGALLKWFSDKRKLSQARKAAVAKFEASEKLPYFPEAAMLKYMTKREKKQLLKRLSKRMSKEILKGIKQSLK